MNSCINCRYRTTEKFYEDKYWFRYGCKKQPTGKTTIYGMNLRRFRTERCELYESPRKQKNPHSKKIKEAQNVY